MYEYTDYIIEFLNKQFVELFDKLKSVLSIDDVNPLESVNETFSNARETTFQAYVILYKRAYKKARNKDLDKVAEDFVLAILDRYDPITKYVFRHEVERKKARLYEAIMASNSTYSKEVDTGLRYWSKMCSQYAIEITDEATIHAYRDMGIKKVKWVTQRDTRVCEICDKRDGEVYDINDIPPKPHWNCRCYLIPVRSEK